VIDAILVQRAIDRGKTGIYGKLYLENHKVFLNLVENQALKPLQGFLLQHICQIQNSHNFYCGINGPITTPWKAPWNLATPTQARTASNREISAANAPTLCLPRGLSLP
jgi:hypothetical protein